MSFPRGADLALLAVGDYAVVWWLRKRPIGWKKSRHLKNPEVNCTTVAECALARAVAEWVKMDDRQPEPVGA